MKLNIFTYGFYPEQFIITEFAADVAKNHQVQVFTGLPNYPKGEFFNGYSILNGPYSESKDSYEIIRYPVFPRKKGFLRLMMNYLSHAIMATLNLFRAQKADWIFVFGISPITIAIPAIMWARLSGGKVCLWLQDLWPDSVAAVGALRRESFLYKSIGMVVRWIYKHIDVMMIQSPCFKENLHEFGYFGPTYLIPNWAPNVDFAHARTPDWYPFVEGAFDVTFAGNIGRAQAIDTVLAAAKILKTEKNIRFLIVGDGSEFERAQGARDQEKLEHVIFFGRKPVQEMPGLFKQSSLLLVSLTKAPIFAKTIPSKVQAYMAAGRPIVASLDGVGASVVTEARCGLSSSAEDAEGLAAAILQISKMSFAERDVLGMNGKKYFDLHYRKEKIVEQILTILESHR